MKTEGYLMRLHTFIHERLQVPYAWGTNDCGTFTGGAVKAVTEVDHLAGLVWTDEASALALIESKGGLIAICDSMFKRRESVLYSYQGDVCLVKAEVAGKVMHSLSICVGAQVAGPGTEGLMLLPLTEARIAWET